MLTGLSIGILLRLLRVTIFFATKRANLDYKLMMNGLTLVGFGKRVLKVVYFTLAAPASLSLGCKVTFALALPKPILLSSGFQYVIKLSVIYLLKKIYTANATLSSSLWNRL